MGCPERLVHCIPFSSRTLLRRGSLGLPSFSKSGSACEESHEPRCNIWVSLSRKTGPLYPFFLAYFVATWLAGLTVFFEKWQRLRGVSRAQMQHLGVAILISGSGAIAFTLFLS